jgi:hypothetical protein
MFVVCTSSMGPEILLRIVVVLLRVGILVLDESPRLALRVVNARCRDMVGGFC